MSTVTRAAAPARTDSGAVPLEVDDVGVTLGGRTVLDGVTFGVPAGRVVGLLGPNGAGKTTLMRILFGIFDPDRGHVRWNGQEVDAHARARWGYMPQERGLYVKMQVHDHLVYLGRLRGLDPGAAAHHADELLEQVGLADRAADKIEQLSGGMQQRVQLAAALVHRPEVLVLDEPFAGLDPVAIEQLSTLIHDEAAQGRTVLFSSHQLDLVEDLCESIVLMDRGSVVLQGELAELRAASERRVLRLGVRDPEPGWAEGIAGATLLHGDASETTLALSPGSDALAVLDEVRSRVELHDFGLELPRLSQLFREAVS